MNWEHLYLLWLLLVIPPALIAFYWWASRTRQKLLAQFIEARLLPALTVGISRRRRKIRMTLMVFAAVFLIIALAGPQHGFDLQEVEQNGLDIMVVIDTSKSMLTQDIAPNRLERAKLAAMELMQDAKSDRLGLVAFAGEGFAECPLTVDDSAFQESVQALDVNAIPEGGTDIAGAIQTAEAAFKQSVAHKIVVLLTDGEDNVNEAAALAAAQQAAKDDVRIFTVGIGTKDGDLIRIADSNGNTDYVRDPQGNVVKSHLNEALLQQIATVTGGFYLPLGAQTMDVLYERGLAPLPKTQGQGKLIRQYHEQFFWPLALAIVLLLVEMFVPERKNQPRAQGLPKATTATAVAVLFALLVLPMASKASPSSALHEYQSGNFTNALAEYSQLAETRTNDFRLVFNAGDAAYRATNFDMAQELFTQAALSPDWKMQQQAYYNLGNAQFESAKDAKDLDGLQAGLEMAEKSYARAVNLNTNDTDAVYNDQFTKNAIEQIKEFREMMLRAKQEADTAVRQAEYHRALEIMAPLQKTVAAKQFQDYTKRLKDIDDISTPHQP
ncbi:MAG TPA: VWA domain-containing protein [Verrucomicrobiae bacterium]|jgi:Ca-activated chloride channel family protein